MLWLAAAVFFAAGCLNNVVAQTTYSPRLPIDSSRLATDSLRIHDTASRRADSLAAKPDTLKKRRLEQELGIRISPDAPDAVVTSTAADSSVMDMRHNTFYLYGKAQVNFEDLEVKAGSITYNQATNSVTAAPLLDTSGEEIERPSFSQGSEKVTYDSMQYNFKSRRAIIRNAHSQYGEGFVQSQQIKRNPDQSIYGWQNVYTTCSLDTPHFGIRARRIKIIPGHIIVSGAANLTIEGIPTPLYLPFGVFPITESQRSGFRIPSYTLEEKRGLGLTQGGYYFYINDYVDLLVLADIYSKGSYNTSFLSTYANRYHYNGGFSFNYGFDKEGEVYEPGATQTKSFAIIWRHQTDAKAHPGASFNANVKIEKSNYFAINSYDLNQRIDNQFSSNITYTKSWQGKPFSFSAALLHNQNTLTHQVQVTLPQINFYVSQFSPFKFGQHSGLPRWYEKITASYSLNAEAQTSFYDTAFHLRTLSLNDFNIGVHHSVPVSASYTLLKYINVSFSANYNEYWLTRQIFQYYNQTENKVDSVINNGFFATRDFNANASLSTRIYGIKRFKKGKIAGIRHVLTPSVGFNYTPDFAAAPFHYYYQSYFDQSGNLSYHSPYDGSVVGTPGLGQYGNFSSAVSFGVDNNLQVKVRTSKDTVTGTKNISLIDGLSLNSSYNIAADSFNWSGIGLRFRTNVLNLLNVTAGADFDPYEFDHETGRRISRTTWSDGAFPRFQDATAGLSATFHSKQKSANSNGQAGLTDEQKRLTRNDGDYVNFNIPWSLNVGYTLSAREGSAIRQTDGVLRPDSVQLTQSFLFSGDFNLTSRWKVTFSSGYDFTTHTLTAAQIDIYRDLHCWEMRLHSIPFGAYKSYTFTLNVKASVLHDLRLLRRRDYRDQ